MNDNTKDQGSHSFDHQIDINTEQVNLDGKNKKKTPKGAKNQINISNKSQINTKKKSKDERLNKSFRTKSHKKFNNQIKEKRRADSTYRKFSDDNLDLSIQEEIMGGNFKMKGKKAQVLINHLLDFNLPEVDRDTHSNARRKYSSKKKIDEDEHINLTGDSFINVNYRLLIEDTGNYSEQINDPNCMISDDKIVSIVVSSGQQCPICLCEKPIAPRMVGCGHIFCYSCLLKFFSIEDRFKDKTTGQIKKKKYKECPLCNNIIRPQRINHVTYLEDSALYIKDEPIPKPGAQVKLDLMFREKASILALPIEVCSNIHEIINIPSINNTNEIKYSRLVKCDSSYKLKLLNEDIEAMQIQNEIDKALYNDVNDQQFIDLALEQINNTIVSILDETQGNLTSNFIKMKIGKQESENQPSMTIDDSSGFYFYQTSHNTSTKYFLSPLDVKILLEIFEKYSNFPSTLEVQVENIHYDTVVTEKLIHRYKYMGHLPLGTEIAFLDINWKEMSILTDKVYEKFSGKLKQRYKELNIKRQREERNKKLYEAKLEEDIMAFYKAENGVFSLTSEQTADYKKLLDSGTTLETLWSKKIDNSNQSISSSSNKNKAYKQNTVWGTSISVIPDEKTYKEDEEFAAMLLQKMRGKDHEIDDNCNYENHAANEGIYEDTSGQTFQNQSSQNGQNGMRKNKKKGKVVLFST